MSELEVKAYNLIVEDHPNADKLNVVKLIPNGNNTDQFVHNNNTYTCIAMKGRFKTGDRALFIPEGSILPENLLRELDMWDEGQNKGKLAGPEGNRVKPLKLRGVMSEGVLYTPRTPGNNKVDLTEDDSNWAERLGITKWEPEIPADMSGEVVPKPEIPRYTEIENIKKGSSLLIGERVVITEKIHGSCMIAYYEYGTLYVSSKGIAKKGLALVNNPNNVYWRVANKLNLRDRLMTLGFPRVALFGEVLGVQDLRYGASAQEPGFRAFDMMLFDSILDPNKKQFFVSWDKLVEFTDFMGLERVPTLFEGEWNPNYLEGMVSGNELVTGTESHIREGLVIKPAIDRHDDSGRVIYKVISEEYLSSRSKKSATEYN